MSFHISPTTEAFQSHEHGLRKGVCLLLAAEVETKHLSVVPPLVESRSGLVVLQSSDDGAVDGDLGQGVLVHVDGQIKLKSINNLLVNYYYWFQITKDEKKSICSDAELGSLIILIIKINYYPQEHLNRSFRH